ncbi:MAG: T9SS type A sorting domain-containing protein [Bacteroidales bacterium]|nr:T9SS type A sorting domain-containing protein [Bacteroidales bacterium]
MKTFFYFLRGSSTLMLGILMCSLSLNAQVSQPEDNPNLDRIPFAARTLPTAPTDGLLPLGPVTVDDFDNFNLGTDFAEGHISSNPLNPTEIFVTFNASGSAGGNGHYTLNGYDWLTTNPSWGGTMYGDVLSAYSGSGYLYYENMYGSGSIQGAKVARSDNGGVSWNSPVIAIAGNDKNWMAADQTNGPYANSVYTTMTNGSAGNFARSTNNGQTWQSTFAPSTQGLPGMMVCVGPDGSTPGGSVYVVTNGGSTFASTYTFYRSLDGGTTFQLMSSQQWAGYVGSNVSNRHSVENMRTRPYPFISADNSNGPHSGRLYGVYTTNDPPGNGNKPDIWIRYSDNGGQAWSAAKRVNDDANSANNHNFMPAVWTDVETGRVYLQWMDTRDCPTSDSALIYATYSDDGGESFVPNQAVSNKKMKINCSTCGGGGTPRYQGDYNAVTSNKKVATLTWTDFRNGSFGSYTSYFPDFALRLSYITNDTLVDSLGMSMEIPAVKLYSDTAVFSADVQPTPPQGSFSFHFPEGNELTSFPGSLPMYVLRSPDVPAGTYLLTLTAQSPNGTPVHKRSQFFKVVNVAPTAGFAASQTGICTDAAIDFYDQSSGTPTSWNWTFSGATPASSTEQNPTGIVYSQTGLYTVILSVSNAYGSNTITKTQYITVSNQPGSPTVTASSACEGMSFSPLGATGTDLTWYSDINLSNQVATGASYTPQVSAAGTYTYYVTQGSSGCESDATPVDLVIYPKPVASFSSIDATCSSYPAFQLTQGSPAGGVYSGPGVSNNMFSPATAGVGTWDLMYIYTSINDCSDTAYQSIEVMLSPDASLQAFTPVCLSEAPFTLTGGTPAGGTFSGTGVQNGIFNPSIAGAGSHTLTYTVAGTGSCDGVAQQSVTVYPLPAVDLGADTMLCANLTLMLDAQTPNVQSYLWYPGGETTSSITIDSTGIGIGTKEFRVTATSTQSCVKTSTINVSFKDCTSINELSKLVYVTVYPNPSDGTFYIDIKAAKQLDIELSVLNTLGVVIHREKGLRIKDQLRTSIQLNGQPEGMYMLMLRSGNLTSYYKLIVRK